MQTRHEVDVTKARLYYPDGTVDHFDNQQLAYAIYLAIDVGGRVAFRGRNDTEPVYAWDYIAVK